MPVKNRHPPLTRPVAPAAVPDDDKPAPRALVRVFIAMLSVGAVVCVLVLLWPFLTFVAQGPASASSAEAKDHTPDARQAALDTLPVGNLSVHELAYSLCERGKHEALAVLLRRVNLSASYLDARGGGTLTHAVLRAWHSSVERDPLNTDSANAAYGSSLALLLKSRLVDLSVRCPLVDAVHYRNSHAVAALLSGALGLPAQALEDLAQRMQEFAVELPRAIGADADARVDNSDSVAGPRAFATNTALKLWFSRLRLHSQPLRPGFSPGAVVSCLLERDAFGQNLLHVAAKSKAAGFARVFVRLRRMLREPTPRVPLREGAPAQPDVLQLLNLTPIDLLQPITWAALNNATQEWDLNLLLGVVHLLQGIPDGSSVHVLDALLSAQDELGLTPLHVAAQSGRIRVVSALLSSGSPTSALDQHNFTAGHFCCTIACAGCLELIRLFDPHADMYMDRFGRAPSELLSVTASSPRAPLDATPDPGAGTLFPQVIESVHSYQALASWESDVFRIAAHASSAARSGWKPLDLCSLVKVGVHLPALLSRNRVAVLRLADSSDLLTQHTSVSQPVVITGALRVDSDVAVIASRQRFMDRFGRLNVQPCVAPYGYLYGVKVAKSSLAEYLTQHMPTAASDVTSGAAAASAIDSGRHCESDAAESKAIDVGVTGAALNEQFELGTNVPCSEPHMHSGNSARCGSVPPPLPPPYVFDSSWLHRDPSLLQGVMWPEFATARYNYTTLRQVAIGPALSGAPPHFHPAAWNGLLVGAKLWHLTPPLCAEFVGDTPVWTWLQARLRGDEATGPGGSGAKTATEFNADAPSPSCEGMYALQLAGDMVYVPDNWGHAVLNLADTVAVALESFG